MMRWIGTIVGIVAVGGAFVFAPDNRTGDATTSTDASVQRGRYLVTIGGCNDCHTPEYMARNGDVPEHRWLTGNPVGFSGPWGTTYPTNLRQHLGTMDEERWVRHARTLETRPPMPWFNLQRTSEDDLRAMYRYIRSLPADDTRVPEFVPPGQSPVTPHIVMTPQPPPAATGNRDQ